MTSIRTEKETLRRVITRWGSAVGDKNHARAWSEIEDAILGLDNAAYDRAYVKAHESGTLLRLMTERDEAYARGQAQVELEAGQLRIERDVARMARDELQRQFDERGRERDRLKQNLEFTEHRRAQVESEIAEANRRISNLQQTVQARVEVSRGPEADHLHGELRAAHDTVRHFNDAHASIFAESLRLRKALETLADRYHARLCGRAAPPHSREGCLARPSAVREAEKALAGESAPESAPESESEPSRVTTVKLTGGEITIDGVLYGVLPNGCLISRSAADSDTVRKMARAIFDDRKPKEEPEIEAVLMGTDVECVDGCGRVVKAGHAAYRRRGANWAGLPLYASEECARKAARPKARPHPPYAAYTDAMRREEERCRCVLHRDQS